jgi:hypothetical protein
MQDLSLRYVTDEQLLEIRESINRELKRRKHDPALLAKLTRAKKTFDELKKQNSSFSIVLDNDLLEISDRGRSYKPAEKLIYLPLILEQDWSFLYDGDKLSENKNYYVYAHCDPSLEPIKMPNGLGEVIYTPFYIGKGTGNRAYDLNRNQGHGIRLRTLKKAGVKESNIVHIFKDNLTELEAFVLESKLIYFFGTIYEPNIKGCLMNLEIGRRPIFKAQIVLEKAQIRITSKMANAYKTSPQVFRELYKLCGGKCERCGDVESLHPIHRVPIRLGGRNELSNLEMTCVTCRKAEKVKRKADFLAEGK